ncbi:MAG: zinc-ribbon domain-containing protein [Desulfobacteraceae bacterium]|nr:zinc-ribbon domain-containing protein [Desulfobacteraceae bacterium]
MNITCHNCNTKLNIPDHKLPKDKESTVACPKCRERIQVPAAPKSQPPVDEKKNSFYQRRFEDRLNALVCVDRAELKSKINSALDQMGLNAEAAVDMRGAFNKMEYNAYQLLIMEDDFDPENKGATGIIERMSAIDMSLRRKICIVLISRKFNTNDNMAALHSSVNNIIHQDDTHHMEAFLSKAVAEHKNLYSIYNESLKLVGKA